MSPHPRLWTQPELDHLAEIYRLLQSNECEIAQLTQELDRLTTLIERGESLQTVSPAPLLDPVEPSDPI
jgi:hypothetical protein